MTTTHEPLILDLADMPPPAYRGAVVSIGNFDGVHRGHRRLLARLRSRARARGLSALVVSFEPHPVQLLRPERAPPPLLWPARKVALLRAAGADAVLLYRASLALLELPAPEFFGRIIRAQLGARGLVEGPDFGFGRGRTGNVSLLETLCRDAEMTLDVVSTVAGEGAAVSSTRVRECLERGEVARARLLLGRPHRVAGTVIEGAKRGRLLGFPTANLDETLGMVPAEGVYAGQVELDGRTWGAALNIGPNPTFGANERKLEVHLIDFAGDLYGRVLEVDLLERLRGTRPFRGPEELKAQLALDVSRARAIRVAHAEAPVCELALTIEEWLRDEVEPALAPTGISLRQARLSSNGVLSAEWSLARPPLPTAALELLFRTEARLRSVFPEVSRLESVGQAPGTVGTKSI